MGTRPKAGRADTGAHKGKFGFKDVHACLSITAVTRPRLDPGLGTGSGFTHSR